MTRLWALAVTALLLGAGAALAQVQPQPPNSTTLCPVTHDCRPAGPANQTRPAAPTAPVAGTIQCPPGTYQIPNTNKCRVK